MKSSTKLNKQILCLFSCDGSEESKQDPREHPQVGKPNSQSTQTQTQIPNSLLSTKLVEIKQSNPTLEFIHIPNYHRKTQLPIVLNHNCHHLQPRNYEEISPTVTYI